MNYGVILQYWYNQQSLLLTFLTSDSIGPNVRKCQQSRIKNIIYSINTIIIHYKNDFIGLLVRCYARFKCSPFWIISKDLFLRKISGEEEEMETEGSSDLVGVQSMNEFICHLMILLRVDDDACVSELCHAWRLRCLKLLLVSVVVMVVVEAGTCVSLKKK